MARPVPDCMRSPSALGTLDTLPARASRGPGEMSSWIVRGLVIAVVVAFAGWWVGKRKKGAGLDARAISGRVEIDRNRARRSTCRGSKLTCRRWCSIPGWSRGPCSVRGARSAGHAAATTSPRPGAAREATPRPAASKDAGPIRAPQPVSPVHRGRSVRLPHRRREDRRASQPGHRVRQEQVMLARRQVRRDRRRPVEGQGPRRLRRRRRTAARRTALPATRPGGSTSGRHRRRRLLHSRRDRRRVRSAIFHIGDDGLRRRAHPFDACMFYYQRDGIAKDAKYAGADWADDVAHPQDAEVRPVLGRLRARAICTAAGSMPAIRIGTRTGRQSDVIEYAARLRRESAPFRDASNIQVGQRRTDLLDEVKWGLELARAHTGERRRFGAEHRRPPGREPAFDRRVALQVRAGEYLGDADHGIGVRLRVEGLRVGRLRGDCLSRLCDRPRDALAEGVDVGHGPSRRHFLQRGQGRLRRAGGRRQRATAEEGAGRRLPLRAHG